MYTEDRIHFLTAMVRLSRKNKERKKMMLKNPKVTVQKCPKCGGSGKRMGKTCSDCAGTGTATDWR